MPVFNPQLITDPRLLTPKEPLDLPELEMPPPTPAPVFVPVPVLAPPKKPKGMSVSPEAARKAQTIYPVEQAQKQQMIDNAKTPTPTGAWGAPA